QERLWFLNRIHSGEPVYNLYKAIRCSDFGNEAVLTKCLDAIVQRHESLRTNFVEVDGRPFQKIHKQRIIAPNAIDLRQIPEATKDATIEQYLRTEVQKPFDLEIDPLLRVSVLNLADYEWILLFSMHHIVSDEESLDLLFNELNILHRHFSLQPGPVRADSPLSLPELPVQFGDYALWERSAERESNFRKSLPYWRAQLGTDRPNLDLPTDFARPAISSTRGATRSLQFSGCLSKALRAHARSTGGSLFTLLFTGFQILLHRYTKQADIAIGTTSSSRTQMELENLIGCFTNTFVLKSKIRGTQSFNQQLKDSRNSFLEAMSHQHVPFEMLVEELKPERVPGGNPLFQVMFTLRQQTGDDFRDLNSGSSKFDLTLSMTIGADTIRAAMEYRSELFKAATIDRMLRHLQTLLEAMLESPSIPIQDLNFVPQEERQLFKRWNQTERPFPPNRTVHELIEEHAAMSPAAIAVSMNGERLSYHELNSRANRLALRLRENGVGPNHRVACCQFRSVELVISLLAVLKSGGAYVALDPKFPLARLETIIADTDCSVLLIDPATFDRHGESFKAITEANDSKLIRTDTFRQSAAPVPDCPNLPPLAGSEDLAYVCYTSGSSGKPKGVCIPHIAIQQLLLNTDYIKLGPGDAIAQVGTCAFDASTFELWAPLLHGARMVIIPTATVLDPGAFATALRQNAISAMLLTTALFHELVNISPGIFKGIRQLLVGGETMHPGSALKVLRASKPVRLLNLYGPTEATTLASWFEVTESAALEDAIPIGKAASNTLLYVLDANRKLVPIGVEGELYIGGKGLARGYWNQPEMDGRSFVSYQSAGKSIRLYRTGDRVRWRADGNLDFLGRIDDQVKIRGFRIEPEELRLMAESHPQVEQALVTTFEQDQSLSLAVYVTGHTDLDEDGLRQFLKRRLPDAMVPAFITILPRFPIHTNGKIDRSALPEPALTKTKTPTAKTEFATETERRLAQLWMDILKVSPLHPDSNFFRLGGHSLAGVRLFSAIASEFGKKPPLAQLFQAPTIRELAATIDKTRTELSPGSLIQLQAGRDRRPLFLIHGAGGGNLWTYSNIVPYLSPDQPVYALESRTTSGLPEFISIEDMATAYTKEIRRFQPQGPYSVGGYCFGGNVAYEIACRLEAYGEQVELLALIDCAPANGSYNQIPWSNPRFWPRFAVNTAYWLKDFANQPARDQLRFCVRKSQSFKRRISETLRGRPPATGGIDLERSIDTAHLGRERISVWKSHLKALRAYHPGRYGGRVTLFRTRGQPLFCSLEPDFGWGLLANGGVRIVPLSGAHEMIFKDPHVQTLSTKLSEHLASKY
ncbi:MAG: amino acid adenylation domain-containing protein, partial [Opitutales bacterium]|nr:amino acid adenylation domain-containing protein [Opitutales bacterium]